MLRVAPEVVFDAALDHGRCVAVRIPADDASLASLAEAVLLPEERAAASRLVARRRRSWVGGRAALRAALARAGIEAGPVLTGERGAPILPAHVAASITHKDDVAAALVAAADGRCVGVDVEADVVRATDIASKVLASGEQAELAALPPAERAREVLLRFSAKEAVYKALDPFVRRYVGFHEVSVVPRPGGDAAVTAHLPPGEGPFAIEVRWRRFEGLILTTARVGRAP